ncbi:slit homolog 1 protein-like [Mytilus edulis]|uniref:slit homolog 1 protein-like n=1 Tax=Mytilus edulis TaxID=6550 RepID=UPI0039F0F69E
MNSDLLAVVLLLSGGLVNTSCPYLCNCDSAPLGLNLYCYERSFSYIPKLPTNTYYVYLHNNKIPSIESYTFNNLINFTYVTLGGNEITTIKQFAFMNLPRLRYLYIEINKITSIEGYAFKNVQSIYNMQLHDNQLTTIRTNTFEETYIKNYLDLSGNYISRIEENAFGNLTTLPLLNLTSNPINCDCGVYPFWSWMHERTSVYVVARCSDGRSVQSLGSSVLEQCSRE